MYLGDLSKAIKVCLWADVVPDILGHRGIGKTDLVKQIGDEWEDPFTKVNSLPVFMLYCATQEVTDLIGFPTKIWESTGEPVIEGVASKVDGDRIITSWAPPDWLSKLRIYCAQFEEPDRKTLEEMKTKGASEDEIWLFWNRPKCIIFLDEAKRAQRDVMQAMYPLILNKTLHTNELPRGARIITADNFTGAYDVREPDEAFMSRFCHLEADAHIGAWHDWARKHNVHSKVVNFLTSNPSFLIAVAKDQADAVVKYVAQPDPRRWASVARVEKYGQKGMEQANTDVANHIIKQVIAGIIGTAACEQYWAFSDTVVSFEDILTGKAKTKSALERTKNEIERDKLRQKLQVEAPQVMAKRAFSATEAENLKEFLVDLGSKERATAVLQNIFMLKNAGELSQPWIDTLMKGKEVMELIQHLMNRKNV
jgi:alkaline phosphatase D